MLVGDSVRCHHSFSAAAAVSDRDRERLVRLCRVIPTCTCLGPFGVDVAECEAASHKLPPEMAFVMLEVLRVEVVLWLSNAVGALYCLLAAPDAHAHVALVPLALASGGTATLPTPARVPAARVRHAGPPARHAAAGGQRGRVRSPSSP